VEKTLPYASPSHPTQPLHPRAKPTFWLGTCGHAVILCAFYLTFLIFGRVGLLNELAAEILIIACIILGAILLPLITVHSGLAVLHSDDYPTPQSRRLAGIGITSALLWPLLTFLLLLLFPGLLRGIF